MIAHFVGFIKRNNFCLKSFSLKSIFHPLGWPFYYLRAKIWKFYGLSPKILIICPRGVNIDFREKTFQVQVISLAETYKMSYHLFKLINK